MARDHLTTSQQQFLELRKKRDTDIAAAKEMGISRSTVSYWKRQKLFRAVYKKLMEDKFDEVVHGAPVEEKQVVVARPLPATAATITQRQDLKMMVQEELDRHSNLIERALTSLMEILEDGTPPQRLKAIELVAKMYGITPDSFAPGNLTVVQQNIMQMFASGRVFNDSDASETPVEAVFREVSADE